MVKPNGIPRTPNRDARMRRFNAHFSTAMLDLGVVFCDYILLKKYSDATRPTLGVSDYAVIYNEDDGTLNIWKGDAGVWVLPDGSPT